MFIKPSACLGALLSLACMAPFQAPLAAQGVTLPQLKQHALQNHPALLSAQAGYASAEAKKETAASYPNPELDLFSGPARARYGTTLSGTSWGVGLSQPFDAPALRSRRLAVAEGGIKTAEVTLRQSRVALLNQVEAAYIGVLRQQSVVRLTEEDRALLEQIRDRVKVRVTTGEAPNYDLIKAEAELLNAEKGHQTAVQRLNQARALLSSLTGLAPLEGVDLAELPVSAPPPQDLEALWQEVLRLNPDLEFVESLTLQAQARLRLERQLRQPQLTLKGGYEQDPETRHWKLGVALPLPLWNQRQGPIREAAAAVDESSAQLQQQRLLLRQALDNAYNRYRIAEQQLGSYEGGILRQAKAALNVAEAAYRFGERGILDYLDAERAHRMVRQDYLNARFELQTSLLEIARLRAQELFGETP